MWRPCTTMAGSARRALGLAVILWEEPWVSLPGASSGRAYSTGPSRDVKRFWGGCVFRCGPLSWQPLARGRRRARSTGSCAYTVENQQHMGSKRSGWGIVAHVAPTLLQAARFGPSPAKHACHSMQIARDVAIVEQNMEPARTCKERIRRSVAWGGTRHDRHHWSPLWQS